MVVGKCNYVDVKRKKSLTTIEFLPDELVFNILLYLSAEDIYNYAILVCWKWYRMIHTCNFVHSHLHHSTPGLAIKNNMCNASDFVAMRKGRIEVSKFSYIPRGGLLASCNGLILEYDSLKGVLEVTNPAIKQHFVIPPLSRPSADCYNPSIAYSAASKVYKVVRTYVIKDDDDSYEWRWAIFTVGVDESWRNVCTQHISEGVVATTAFTTEGFVHWPSRRTNVVTLNVDTEVITMNPVPQGYENRICDYFSGGKSLSTFVRCSEYSFEVWDMKPETGEWTKLHKVDLGAHKCKFEHLYGKRNSYRFMLKPTGWLKYREVLVLVLLRSTRVCFAYNFRTHEINSVELDRECHFQSFLVHTNSLVWLT